MPTKNIIEMKNINKLYPGIQALNGVDFIIRRGEAHCLVGQNGSGKSTLIKILSGVEKPEPDSKIIIDGELCNHLNSKISMEKGIQVIYQDLSLFPNLTVAENIAFGSNREKHSKFVNWKNMDKIARKALDEIGVNIQLHKKVEELSIAQQQLVEIAKALTVELKLLILDEPTASLTKREVNSLFRVISRLKEKGISILFVSHKLNEVFEVAEQVTILRDGLKIGVYSPKELDHDKLVYFMTNTREDKNHPKPLEDDADVILNVKNLTKARNYKDISFELKKGEILGITGLLGSGRTELALSLFGMNPPDSGEIIFEKQEVKWRSNREAISAGIGYVPEDRMNHGLIMDQPIIDNITITTLLSYVNKAGLLEDGKRLEMLNEMKEELKIRMSLPEAAVKTLSGGNQQKIVLAKWLKVNPKILILDEPTIGIDVIAKNSIHTLIKVLANLGMSIIMISSEIQEVQTNCHRILIMRDGKILCEFKPDELTEDELLEKYNLS
ncbi:MAG: hypothetical protein CVU98_00150 [Firmicutes bacterium HGW-Firmicutes-3]|nr:MAG: hypothetical protein CVU98_00150 [Firmicutes bacterium HGW-Firmicutes-3]